ncbi:MAG: cobyric acid synthase, partial [Desulfobacterales bacterium]|nr:cobyric acid synthase [Desulfobacterales bacterium]
RIRRYYDSGGHVLGICGGYQMLGRKITDPEGLEGEPGETPGLGLLPVETRLSAPKTTTRARFTWGGVEAAGYEIHMGQTLLSAGSEWINVIEQNGKAVSFFDGCASEDGRVRGTYMHGLFDTPGVLKKWLAEIGLPELEVANVQGFAARDAQYELLARYFENHADVDGMMALMGITPKEESG